MIDILILLAAIAIKVAGTVWYVKNKAKEDNILKEKYC